MTTYLLCCMTWPFENRTFSVFAGEDRRVYARLRDLCAVGGLDFSEQLHAIGESKLLAEHLVTYVQRNDSPWPSEPEVTLEPCLNLVALTVWLGTLDPRELPEGDQRDSVLRFRRTYEKTFWLLIQMGYVVNAPSDDHLEAAEFMEVIPDESSS